MASAVLPQLTRSECLNSLAYSQYLHALYFVMKSSDFARLAAEAAVEDALQVPLPAAMTSEILKLNRSKSSVDRVQQARLLLESAARNYAEAIGLLGESPRGMFVYNSGRTKYYLALLRSMGEDDSPAETSAMEEAGEVAGDTEEDEPAEKGAPKSALTLDEDELELMKEALADLVACVELPNFGTTAEGFAMCAQAHAVLGNMGEAEVAATQADDFDGKVFLIDLTSPEQLLTPWPLPQPKVQQANAPHTFEQTRFLGPHFCDHCLKMITALRTAYSCKCCEFRVHRQCLDKAQKCLTCWPDKGPSGFAVFENLMQGGTIRAPASHVHSFKETLFHKPTWCDACGSFVQIPRGFQCVECRFRAHVDCIDQLDHCVVVGDEATLREVDESAEPLGDLLKTSG